MSKPKDHRRQIIISKEQLGVVRALAWPAAVALIFVVAIGGIVSGRFLAEVEGFGLEVPSVWMMLLGLVALVVGGVSFVVFMAIRVSHQLLGASYGLCKTIQAVQAGDLKRRATLRPEDRLQDLAVELNGFLDWVEMRIGESSEPPDETAAADLEAIGHHG